MIEKSEILNQNGVERVLERMAHEIAEENDSRREEVVVIGIQQGGIIVSKRLAAKLGRIWGVEVPWGCVDVGMHRDDLHQGLPKEMLPTDIEFDLTGRTVVMVDDVLFSGRTTRSAMDALTAFGRAQRIQLAVLIDRGHRELPIRADFVGKEQETRKHERIEVQLNEEGQDERVLLVEES